MTVITIIAIAGIAAFFATIIWPKVRNSVNDQFNQSEKTQWGK